MVYKNCAQCQIWFDAERPATLYCNRDCWKAYKASHVKPERTDDLVPKKCLQCDTPYKVQRRFAETSAFCSRRCSSASRKVPGLLADCHQCGKTFEYKPNSVSGKFCGWTCRRAHQASLKTFRQCLVCTKTFLVIPALKQRKKFCSQSCLGIYSHQVIRANGATQIERSVSEMLATMNVIYVPEFRISQWLCDFYVPIVNLVIECDGTYWHSIPKAIARDQRKDKWLAKRGYKLLRLPEQEIKNSPATCLEKIRAAIYG